MTSFIKGFVISGSPDGDDDYPLDESPRNDNDNEFEEAMTLHNRNQLNLSGSLQPNIGEYLKWRSLSEKYSILAG